MFQGKKIQDRDWHYLRKSEIKSGSRYGRYYNNHNVTLWAKGEFKTWSRERERPVSLEFGICVFSVYLEEHFSSLSAYIQFSSSTFRSQSWSIKWPVLLLQKIKSWDLYIQTNYMNMIYCGSSGNERGKAHISHKYFYFNLQKTKHKED